MRAAANGPNTTATKRSGRKATDSWRFAVSLTVCRSATSASTAKPARGQSDRESAGNPLVRASVATSRALTAARNPAYSERPEIPASKPLEALKNLPVCA